MLSFAATKLLSLKSSLHGGRGGGGQCGWRTSVPCRRQGLGCNGTMARAPPILRLPTPPCQAPHLYLLSAFGFGISLAYHTCRFKSLSLPSLTLRSEGGRRRGCGEVKGSGQGSARMARATAPGPPCFPRPNGQQRRAYAHLKQMPTTAVFCGTCKRRGVGWATMSAGGSAGRRVTSTPPPTRHSNPSPPTRTNKAVPPPTCTHAWAFAHVLQFLLGAGSQ